ncbi:MAG: hypothetical protein ATN36_08055 [Epulopiscium sp. Nele67-Bin005]|nr:MAG: hypothetical protein ATN36_08055 [Epulopiscium sp. Nele67-Bin005]
MTRIEKEKHIIQVMIGLYCKKNHKDISKNEDKLCDECNQLLIYAQKRLDKCRHGEEKSFCSKCPTQCYNPKNKDKIKEVMKFSGPRMLFYEPVEVIKHLKK